MIQHDFFLSVDISQQSLPTNGISCINARYKAIITFIVKLDTENPHHYQCQVSPRHQNLWLHLTEAQNVKITRENSWLCTGEFSAFLCYIHILYYNSSLKFEITCERTGGSALIFYPLQSFAKYPVLSLGTSFILSKHVIYSWAGLCCMHTADHLRNK